MSVKGYKCYRFSKSASRYLSNLSLFYDVSCRNLVLLTYPRTRYTVQKRTVSPFRNPGNTAIVQEALLHSNGSFYRRVSLIIQYLEIV